MYATLLRSKYYCLAIFYYSNILQQTETCNYKIEKFIARDIVIKKNKSYKDIFRDIYKININKKNNNSISLY